MVSGYEISIAAETQKLDCRKIPSDLNYIGCHVTLPKLRIGNFLPHEVNHKQVIFLFFFHKSSIFRNCQSSAYNSGVRTASPGVVFRDMVLVIANGATNPIATCLPQNLHDCWFKYLIFRFVCTFHWKNFTKIGFSRYKIILRDDNAQTQ